METLLVEAFGPLAVALILYVAISGARRFIHQVRNRLSPEQLQAARDSYRNRLVHPRAEEVEQGIGALLPQRLLTLYDDHQTILTEQIEIRRPDTDSEDAAIQKDLAGPKLSAEWIEAFLPLDLESQKYTVDLAVFGCGKDSASPPMARAISIGVPSVKRAKRTLRSFSPATIPLATNKSPPLLTNSSLGLGLATGPRRKQLHED